MIVTEQITQVFCKPYTFTYVANQSYLSLILYCLGLGGWGRLADIAFRRGGELGQIHVNVPLSFAWMSFFIKVRPEKKPQSVTHKIRRQGNTTLINLQNCQIICWRIFPTGGTHAFGSRTGR